MLEDLLFLSSAFAVAAFLAAVMFGFTNIVANQILIVSFVVLIATTTTTLIVDHNIVHKLKSWWS
jgi:hypothetical protein